MKRRVFIGAVLAATVPKVRATTPKKLSVEEIAALFDVPFGLIEPGPYTNLDAASKEFAVKFLKPWLESYEKTTTGRSDVRCVRLVAVEC